MKDEDIVEAFRGVTGETTDERLFDFCGSVMISVASKLKSDKSVLLKSKASLNGKDIGDWVVTVEKK